MKSKLFLSLFSMVLFFSPFFCLADQPSTVSPKERCEICGMFVAKYSNWLTQIKFKNGQRKSFDGMKDMLVYYFNLKKYNHQKTDISTIFVKDYYRLEWFDARKGYFIIHSDTYGPMGHEFIPFSDKEAALAFMADHHGKQILTFSEITNSLVESLRTGMKMQ